MNIHVHCDCKAGKYSIVTGPLPIDGDLHIMAAAAGYGLEEHYADFTSAEEAATWWHRNIPGSGKAIWHYH